MPRAKRVCPAADVFHVLHRSVVRLTIFEKPEDYNAFLRALGETWRPIPLPVLALVVMPNHGPVLFNTVSCGPTTTGR